ncbi:unnamed protein product [Rotaria magnacalcarata]
MGTSTILSNYTDVGTASGIHSIAPTTEVITDEILQDSSTINISIPTNVISEQENSSNENPNEENKFILSDVVRSSIERIPKRLMNTKKVIRHPSAGQGLIWRCSNCHQLPSGGPPMTSSADDFSPTTSTCSIRIWDAPGIEDWIKLDVAKHIQTLVDEKNPICLIYCTSPGSYANVEHIKIVIDQCSKLKVFIALVVTNMYASDEADDILENFKSLLAYHNI